MVEFVKYEIQPNSVVKFKSVSHPYIIYARYLEDKNRWDSRVEILYNPRPDAQPIETRGHVITKFKGELIPCTKEDILELTLLIMGVK